MLFRSGARWDTRLWRDFFAAPLVSKLPDGFGSKPNPILLRKRCIRGYRFRQRKRHTNRCAFCIGGSGAPEYTFCEAKLGSVLSQSRLGARSQGARRKNLAKGEYPTEHQSVRLLHWRKWYPRIHLLRSKIGFGFEPKPIHSKTGTVLTVPIFVSYVIK